MGGKVDWKKYYREHKDERLAQSNLYYKKNKESVLKKMIKYRENNKEKILEKNRLYKYKLDNKQFEEILKKQEYKCVCGENITRKNSYCVDHDHSCCFGKKTCGKCIRGLMCKNCNLAIGYAKDNPKTLIKLASYLYKYKVGLLSFKKAIETHGVCFVSGV